MRARLTLIAAWARSKGFVARFEKLERVWKQRVGYLAFAHDDRSGSRGGIDAAGRGGESNNKRKSARVLTRCVCIVCYIWRKEETGEARG